MDQKDNKSLAIREWLPIIIGLIALLAVKLGVSVPAL